MIEFKNIFSIFQQKVLSEDETLEDYKKITNLRAKYPHLKIHLAAFISDFFPRALEEHFGTKYIAEYYENVTKFIKNINFDGIDLQLGNLELK